MGAASDTQRVVIGADGEAGGLAKPSRGHGAAGMAGFGQPFQDGRHTACRAVSGFGIGGVGT